MSNTQAAASDQVQVLSTARLLNEQPGTSAGTFSEVPECVKSGLLRQTTVYASWCSSLASRSRSQSRSKTPSKTPVCAAPLGTAGKSLKSSNKIPRSVSHKAEAIDGAGPAVPTICCVDVASEADPCATLIWERPTDS